MTQTARTANSASTTNPSPQVQNTRPALDLALAIVGAVCGTLITSALPGESSPTLNLVGAAMGAAVPPFVATVGKWRHLRATAAVVVTIAALCFTYMGSFFVDEATGSETSTFPAPRWGAAGTTTTDPPPAESTTAPMLIDKVGIAVTPEVLTCTPKCDSKVTIRSTGKEPLVVAAIEFDGPAKAAFRQSGPCALKQYEQREECSFDVVFSQAGKSGKQFARLVINQNLPGPATFVDLVGEGPVSGLDLAVSSDHVECAYQPAGALGGKNTIRVSFHLSLTGTKPNDLPGLIPVVARSTSGPEISFTTAVSNGPKAVVVAALPLATGSYNRPHDITIAVDPDNKIVESDETNNQLRVSLDLPAKPKSAVALNCSATQGLAS